MKSPISATRAAVIDGSTIELQLLDQQGIVAKVDIGPTDAIELASDVLNAACRRLGRIGGPLPDVRHEQFAQLRAAGRTQVDAYEGIGNKPDKSNAARYEKRHPLLRIRIGEIKAAMAKAALATMLSAARPAGGLSFPLCSSGQGSDG
jgi:hypothetical protein